LIISGAYAALNGHEQQYPQFALHPLAAAPVQPRRFSTANAMPDRRTARGT
jgi:hypothetical protein